MKYSALLTDSKSPKTSTLFELLEKAQICSRIYHSSCNGIPLAAERNRRIFKTIFLDVGLVSRLLNLDWRDIQSPDELTLIHQGSLAEQYIGQHLQWDSSQPADLHYWVRESKNSNAKLDYVCSRGSMLVPIEVKSGKSGTLKSLHQFMFEKKLQHAIRFDSLKPSTQTIKADIVTIHQKQKVTYQLLSLPLYAIEKLPQMIDRIREENNSFNKM